MSDVLAGMQVRSFGYARLEARAPWGVSFAKHSASLGMVLEGRCWFTMQRMPRAVELNAGDCFLIAHGDAHALRDHLDTPTRAYGEILGSDRRSARVAGNGAASVVVGGWFRFDPLSSRPLTKILPPLIHISAASVHALGLDTTLQSLANETRESGPGSEIVVNRLAEILFIQMIRAFVASDLNSKPGWLGALADTHTGAALHLMHEKVDRHWTVGDLAHAVGLSRSAFAHRFRQLVGEAPMEYLTNWRMFKACRLLRSSDLKLSHIAGSVGYDSEAAFCHAFKRVLGVTPSEYRTAGNTAVRGALDSSLRVQPE
jgi:AraC-like DNA-binding protein